MRSCPFGRVGVCASTRPHEEDELIICDADLRTVTVEMSSSGSQKAREAGARLLAIPDLDYRQWKISTKSERNLTRAWERLAGRAND